MLSSGDFKSHKWIHCVMMTHEWMHAARGLQPPSGLRDGPYRRLPYSPADIWPRKMDAGSDSSTRVEQRHTGDLVV